MLCSALSLSLSPGLLVSEFLSLLVAHINYDQVIHDKELCSQEAPGADNPWLADVSSSAHPIASGVPWYNDALPRDFFDILDPD